MRKLVVATAVLLLSVVGLGSYAIHWFNTPLNVPDEGLVYVLEKGGSLSRASQDLERQGVLRHGRWLSLYGRLSGRTAIRAGEYHLTTEDTPARLMARLERGDVITYQVTLVEGWTFRQALETLQAQEKIRSTLTSQDAIEQFIAELDVPDNHPEGWFFPDTYRYIAGNSDREILTHAHRRMRDVLSTEWENRSVGLPYQSPYEALIMASIVERETGVPEERGQIAGVFVRRLERNMRLQTDPTVIYGLADAYDGTIRRSHLRQPTPYNTYVIKGLPPTPIALPGQASIRAALNPEDGTALYFVARGDGSHHFSETLEEHNRAVRKYQLQRRADYRSSPTPIPTSSSNEEE